MHLNRETPRTALLCAARVPAALLALALAGCGAPQTRPAESGLAPTAVPLPAPPAGFTDGTRKVNGVTLHYVLGGHGPPVVLLHGFGEPGLMWRPLMPQLAQQHTVLVPDLRGAGWSEKTEGGYDKLTMAQDIHALAAELGLKRVAVVGHDIGLMVAYAYAAQFPQDTERVVLMDAFLPGIGNWKDMWLMRDLWHFHVYREVPLALVTGRERTYLEHFWNDFAADPKHSLPEDARELYARIYAQPGAMRAGMEWFRNFERDASDFSRLGSRHLAMPVLVIAGEKSGSDFLVAQVRLVADDVRGQVVKGAGHWLMEEAPKDVMPAIVDFLRKDAP
jgi:pimeloyl-ACP methyl ester carboxylesterase